jgi:hypothetical protein
MTFREKCKFCKVVLWLTVALLVALPLGAQIQFSGQITTNSSTPVTLANSANYTEAGSAAQGRGNAQLARNLPRGSTNRWLSVLVF